MGDIRDRIINRINGLENIPALGRTISQVQKLICARKESEIEVHEIAGFIEKDIGLAVKVLKIANSVYYGGRYGEIGSIQQAVTRLGLDEVYKLCIAMSTMRIFPDTSNLIDLKDFWRHSTSVARVTRSISEKSRRFKGLDTESAYASGLFHDIGILVLDRYFPDVYQKIRETSEGYADSVHTLEKELLEIDHGEIGGLILAKWKLPENIVHAVSWHHNPNRTPSEFRSLTQLVHIADFACSALGSLEPGESLPDACSFGAWHDLDIDVNRIRDMVDEVEEEILRSNIFVNIGI